jgi:hypothetical protein
VQTEISLVFVLKIANVVKYFSCTFSPRHGSVRRLRMDEPVLQIERVAAIVFSNQPRVTDNLGVGRGVKN